MYTYTYIYIYIYSYSLWQGGQMKVCSLNSKGTRR